MGGPYYEGEHFPSVPAEDVKHRGTDETSTGNRYWVVEGVRLEVSPDPNG